MTQTPLFLPSQLHFPPHLYFLTRDWPILSHWLQYLPTLLSQVSFPDLSLLLPPSSRQKIAENHIRHLTSSPFHSFPLDHHHITDPPHDFFACDGSMVTNAVSRRRTITFAVASPQSAFAASLHPSAHQTNILHGEVYGLVASSILSSHIPHAHLFSDHLNSVRLLSTNLSLLSLRNNSARSLYRWLLSLWSSGPQPQLNHVRTHTNATDIPSRLNNIADSLATASQSFPLLPSSAPVPTSFMDLFMLFSPSHGCVESSITSFIDSSLARFLTLSLNTCQQPLPPLPLFNTTPPPSYPYTKAPSSYSAMVQLYARSGQLDTRLSLSTRLKGAYQPGVGSDALFWRTLTTSLFTAQSFLHSVQLIKSVFGLPLKIVCASYIPSRKTTSRLSLNRFETSSLIHISGLLVAPLTISAFSLHLSLRLMLAVVFMFESPISHIWFASS